jgi:hypothetical protein
MIQGLSGVVRPVSESSDSKKAPLGRGDGGLVPATPPPLPGHASTAPPAYPKPSPVSPPPAARPPPRPVEVIYPTHARNARLSLLALVGALWGSLFFVMLALSSIQLTLAPDAADPAWRGLLNFTLLPLGFTAPIATTVLGLLAIGRIQRSEGHLYGLSLALFDALLYPLMLLDILIFWIGFQIDHLLVSRGLLSGATAAILFRQALPTIICVLGDYYLATRTWSAVQPGAGRS